MKDAFLLISLFYLVQDKWLTMKDGFELHYVVLFL